MTDNNIIVLIVLSIIGGFCLGYLFGARAVQSWRIKWIELEHDTARELNRKPRNINDILIAILVVSILVLPSLAEARGGSGTVRHDGYNSNRNRSTHRIVPVVQINRGNQLSTYPEQQGLVGTFPVRTYIPRGGNSEQGR